MTPLGSPDESMERARAAGLPDEHLAVLLAARRHWWAERQGGPATVDAPVSDAARILWDGSLDAALAHPAAAVFDEVFIAAMRRRKIV